MGFLDVLGWVIPVLMLPVVASRHSPTAALAWLIFLFFQPWAGLAGYLLFGGNRVIRRLAKSYCQRIREIRALQHLAVHKPGVLHPQPERIFPLEILAERLTCLPVAMGNHVELLDDGYRVIERMVADIDSAKSHIHFLFYIYRDDAIGRRVADAMARAVQRGVAVRLVVDAFGSRFLARGLGQWMQERGVRVHSLMSINPFRRHHTRLDLRNHRKLAVIDGKIAYTGSQNIEVKDYDHGRANAWHDIMVRIIGPAVLHLQMVFVEDWYLAAEDILEGGEYFPFASPDGRVPIQVVPTGPMDPNTALRDILITAIGTARESIILTSPYFIPDEPFRVALHLASLRGVRVDLLIPRRTDHAIVGAVARAYLSPLVESGVNIHFHRGVLHSKTMTVDRTLALIGTANFDRRSFFLHSELNLLLYGEGITGRLKALQAAYMAQSVPLDPERWRNRSAAKRVRDDILKILSPIL